MEKGVYWFNGMPVSTEEFNKLWEESVMLLKENNKPKPPCSSEEACSIVEKFLEQEEEKKLSFIEKIFHKHKWKRQYHPYYKTNWKCKCGATRESNFVTDEWERTFEYF